MQVFTKKKNRPKSRAELTSDDRKKIKQHHSTLLFLLEKNSSDGSITLKLDYMKRQKLLDAYLQETKYEIFQKGLMNDNDGLELIKELSTCPSERCQFLMVAHNNYLALREYINGILQLNPEDYQKVSSIKCSILKIVIKIKPDPILDFIRQVIAEKKEGSAVAEVFLQDIDAIAAALQPKLVENGKRKRSSSRDKVTHGDDGKVKNEKIEVVKDDSGALPVSIEYTTPQMLHATSPPHRSPPSKRAKLDSNETKHERDSKEIEQQQHAYDDTHNKEHDSAVSNEPLGSSSSGAEIPVMG